MPYTITDIEVTQPLPTLTLSESDTGIALIVRRKGKPIGFLMKALPIRWWFKYQLRQVKKLLRARHPLPLQRILAALWGSNKFEFCIR